MRQVGQLPNQQQARQFVDFLTTLGIESREEFDDGQWAIWVMDEERIPQAQEELEAFQANPEDPRYQKVAEKAEALRREKTERQRAAAKNVVEMRGQWKRASARKAPLTFLLIAAAIVLFLLAGYGMNWDNRVVQWLAFAPPYLKGTEYYSADAFHLIKQGQLWRLVTPIFLHGDIWHIFFNVYVLFYFGTQFENRRGWIRLLLFAILSAAFSNSAEAIVQMSMNETYPTTFGGMSGVNYALFGYVWMQSRFLPKSGFVISQFTIILLVGWFFAGFTGWLGNIANAAHGAGLFFGMVIGYLPVLFPSLEEKI